MTDALDSERRWTAGRALLALWSGVLLPPLAWVLHLNVSYALATLACQHARMALLLTAVVSLAVAGVGGAIGWRVWGEIGPGHEADGSVIGRSRFMAIGSVALAILFAVVIVVQTIPTLIYTSCE